MLIGYNMLMSAKQKKPDAPRWSYDPEGDDDPITDQPDASQPRQESRYINWTASEFVEIQRNSSWKMTVILGFVLLCAVAYLITKDYISSIFIGVAGIIFLVASSRKPRQLTYEVNDKGVQVGSNFYSYSLFKSFDVLQEGGIRSVNLMPMKRFMPEISIYFPPEQEEAIVDVISSHLPHDEHTENAVDKMARKLHF